MRCTARNLHHRRGQGSPFSGSAAWGKLCTMNSRNTSRTFGTATRIVTCRDRICLTISRGLVLDMKRTEAGISGGTNVASACPNRWLIGRRFRIRRGENGRTYLRYGAIWSSIGARFAARLPCVITTPFGSAVVPEVKTISAISALERGTGSNEPRFVLRSTSDKRHTGS